IARTAARYAARATTGSVGTLSRLLKNGCGRRVRGFRPQAFASRTAAESLCYRGPFAPWLPLSSGASSARSKVASLLDDGNASPSSRFLASDPAALVTPSHTFFSNLLRRGVQLGDVGRSEEDAPGASRGHVLLERTAIDELKPSGAAGVYGDG